MIGERKTVKISSDDGGVITLTGVVVDVTEPETFTGGMVWLTRYGVTATQVVFQSAKFPDAPEVRISITKWRRMGSPMRIGVSYGIEEYFRDRSEDES